MFLSFFIKSKKNEEGIYLGKICFQEGHITGCGSHFRNPAPFNILKKPLLVQKQTIHEQKALDFSFNLAP